MTSPKIVLASASKTRAKLLENAGVTVDLDPAHVDEDGVKDSLKAEGATAVQVAETLAELKAVSVSRRHPDALVIGGDQTLDCNGTWFDKPVDMDHVRAHLMALRGKTHRLNAAVCVVRNGERQWHLNDAAEMTMRPFSDDFLNWYIDACGEEVCGSVGGYQLEGPGAQLFSAVRGDYFTVLGLPLLPLMEFLRANGGLVK